MAILMFPVACYIYVVFVARSYRSGACHVSLSVCVVCCNLQLAGDRLRRYVTHLPSLLSFLLFFLTAIIYLIYVSCCTRYTRYWLYSDILNRLIVACLSLARSAPDVPKNCSSLFAPFVSFSGIPYAKPPVGELRWRPPQPVQPWEGVKVARRFGPEVGSTTRLHIYSST